MKTWNKRWTTTEHVSYTLRCSFLSLSFTCFPIFLSRHNWVRSLGTHTGLTIKCGCTINIYCLLLSFRAVFVVCSSRSVLFCCFCSTARIALLLCSHGNCIQLYNSVIFPNNFYFIATPTLSCLFILLVVFPLILCVPLSRSHFLPLV